MSEIREKTVWNTLLNRNTCAFVHLKSSLCISLEWKISRWIDEIYISNTLIGRKEALEERVNPEYHNWDGSYTKQRIKVLELEAEVESVSYNNDYYVRVKSLNHNSAHKLIVAVHALWNNDFTFSAEENSIRFKSKSSDIIIQKNNKCIDDFFIRASSPNWVFLLNEDIYIYTGDFLSNDQIDKLLEEKRRALIAKAEDKFKDLANSYLAIQAGLSWNIIYDPSEKRQLLTVGRLWNEEYGGYCLFGWDNFFLPLVLCLESPNLAGYYLKTHLSSITEEGFIPNDDRGNKSKSFDRSQPPVGALMTWLLYINGCDQELLKEALEPLYKWNRWWLKRRLNGELLSYGSHLAKNPMHEPGTNSLKTAKYESGMDDSPMYSEVVYNKENAVMELWDVGLNSLFLTDCIFLKKISEVLNDEEKSLELDKSITYFQEKIEKLYDQGIYRNYNTVTAKHSERISPTVFYPLFFSSDNENLKKELSKLFYAQTKFGGDFILPSVPRDDPEYHKQCYWKGAIWPPLNFLVYLGFKFSNMTSEASELAQKSRVIFDQAWINKSMVCENYSSINGEGDDPKLSSDSFHSWGILMGLMAFIEKGYLKLF